MNDEYFCWEKKSIKGHNLQSRSLSLGSSCISCIRDDFYIV